MSTSGVACLSAVHRFGAIFGTSGGTHFHPTHPVSWSMVGAAGEYLVPEFRKCTILLSD